MTRVLVTGCGGQLGFELQRSVLEGVEATFVTSKQLDITDAAAVAAKVAEVTPDVIINAAAYTAVDKAESEPEVAHRVNAVGPENLATACKPLGVRLIHISTDFVFDGTSSVPYKTDDQPSPCCVYGHTKWQGEQAVLATLDNAVIIRTAWVYSAHGNNFVKTMLRLMAEKPEMAVIVDQVGTPTWAHGLAQRVWDCVKNPEVKGTLHWTDAGVASWYDFAVAIQEISLELGLLPQAVPVRPIPEIQYPLPAKRPHFGVLDKSLTYQALQAEPIHWRSQLRSMLAELVV